MLYAADATGAQSFAIHHKSIKLDPSVAGEEAATAGIEGFVIFHGNDRGFDGGKSVFPVCQQLPSGGHGGANTALVGLDHVIWDRPGATMDDQHRRDSLLSHLAVIAVSALTFTRAPASAALVC